MRSISQGWAWRQLACARPGTARVPGDFWGWGRLPCPVVSPFSSFFKCLTWFKLMLHFFTNWGTGEGREGWEGIGGKQGRGLGGEEVAG